jgi:hypothetical protein
MKVRLKQDIVIKAGTVFDTAPIQVVRAIDGFVEHIFAVGDSANTYGSLVYFVGTKESEEREEISDFFEEVE